MAQNVFVNPKVAPVHDSDKDRRQGHAGGGGSLRLPAPLSTAQTRSNPSIMPVVSGNCRVFSIGGLTGARDGAVVSGSIVTVAWIMPGSVAAAGWRFVVRLDALQFAFDSQGPSGNGY